MARKLVVFGWYVFPLVFISLALAEIFFVWDIVQSEKDLLRTMENIFFLNAIHVVFTTMMVRSIPELKEWNLRYRAKKGWSFLAESGFVFLVLWVVCLFLSFHSPDGEILRSYATIAFGLWHGLLQSYGIALLYGRNKKVATRFDEAFWVKVVFLLAMITWTLRNISLEELRAVVNFKAVRTGLVICALSVILWNAYSQSRAGIIAKWKAFTFRLRYSLHVLAAFSLFGSVGAGCVHGTEYLAVTRKMLQKDEQSRRVFFNPWTFGLWIVPLLFMVLLISSGEVFSFVALYLPLTDEHRQIMKVTFGSLSMLHFYQDGILFRFRDSDTREQVAPLLHGLTERV